MSLLYSSYEFKHCGDWVFEVSQAVFPMSPDPWRAVGNYRFYLTSSTVSSISCRFGSVSFVSAQLGGHRDRVLVVGHPTPVPLHFQRNRRREEPFTYSFAVCHSCLWSLYKLSGLVEVECKCGTRANPDISVTRGAERRGADRLRRHAPRGRTRPAGRFPTPSSRRSDVLHRSE